MGSVTAPERARDTVEMARITFGADYLEDHPVILSLINANSPLVWDSTMLGRGAGLRRGQPGDAHHAVHPRRRDGAGDRGRRRAPRPSPRRSAGMTFVQLVRPGRAGRPRVSSRSSMSMQSGAPTFGTPEPALVLYVMAALARRLGVPFRSGGSLCASKIADAQAAYESAATLQPTVLGRRQLRAPRGRLARGRAGRRLREVHPRRRPVRDDGRVRRRASTCPRTARRSTRSASNEPGQHFLGTRPHAGQLRDRVLPLRDRRQQQLRAVAARTARSTPPSAPTRSGSGCSPSTRRRRSTRAIDEALLRLHRPAQGVDARLGGLARVLFRRRSVADAARRGGARRASSPPRPSSSCRSRTRSTRPRSCRPGRRSR